MNEAKAIADKLGKIESDEEWVQKETARLNRKSTVALEHIKELHNWLDGKRKSRRSCRIVGESRTGKTVACEALCYEKQAKKNTSRETN